MLFIHDGKPEGWMENRKKQDVPDRQQSNPAKVERVEIPEVQDAGLGQGEDERAEAPHGHEGEQGQAEGPVPGACQLAKLIGAR